jgi:hypothetical protein
MSACLAAYQRSQNPTNEYLDISQESIRTTLPRLFAIDKMVAREALKSAAR